MLRQTRRSRIFASSLRKLINLESATSHSNVKWNLSNLQGKRILIRGNNDVRSMEEMSRRFEISNSKSLLRRKHLTSMLSLWHNYVNKHVAFNDSLTTRLKLLIQTIGKSYPAGSLMLGNVWVNFLMLQRALLKNTPTHKPCLSSVVNYLSVLQNWQERLSKR